MDFIDWRIFIGVAVFIAGWMLGRIDMEQVVARARAVPDRISAGVRALLRKQRDVAAEEFLAAAQPLEPANVEYHFIAAELQRKNGDYEKTIRIHKRILKMPEMPDKVRARACYELGLDYQQAGFIDLAEECFSQLNDTEYAERSIVMLFNLHVYSRNWSELIANEQRFSGKDGVSELRRNVVAQLYCEWAADVPPEKANELLAKALERDPRCSRAMILLAEKELAEGNAKEAQKLLSELLHRSPLLPLIASLLLRAHRSSGNLATGIRILREAFEREPSELLFSQICAAFAEVGADGELISFTELGLEKLRGTVPAARWLEARQRLAESEGGSKVYAKLRSSLGQQDALFTCRKCGFQSRSHHWQCPSCRSWETMLESDASWADRQDNPDG